MDSTDDERSIAALIATGKWSRDNAYLSIRAGHCCEYCGLDLLASPDSYKLWQVDHIVPRHKGGSDEVANKAVACRVCNMDYKGRWDPREAAPTATTREELIEAVRSRIAERREAVRQEVDLCRVAIGRTPL